MKISVIHNVRSWTDIFGERKIEDTSLEEIEIEVVDEQLMFPQEEDHNVNLWENTAVGYVVGLWPHIPTMESHQCHMWKDKGDLESITHGKDSFILRFSDPEEMKQALEGGPWFIRGKPFLLKKWEQGESLEKECLMDVLVWIHLYNVPWELWGMKMFTCMESFLGKQICTDRMTKSCRCLDVIRIHVHMSSKSEFLEQILMHGKIRCFNIKVEYMWTPSKCHSCGTFAHDTDSYRYIASEDHGVTDKILVQALVAPKLVKIS